MKYTHTEQDREYYLMSLEEVMEGIINNNQDLINTLKSLNPFEVREVSKQVFTKLAHTNQ